MLKSITKNIFSSVLSIFIIFLLSSIILLGASSILINANTAAHIWFDVPVDSESWLEKPKYDWKHSEKINEIFIQENWINVLSDVPINYYTPEVILLSFAKSVNSDVNIDIVTESQFDNSIFDVLESESLVQYTNEFIRQQAGYLIGDNSLPSPSKADIKQLLTTSMQEKGSEQLQRWFLDNEDYLVESFFAVLLSSNKMFDEKIIGSDSSFAESVLVFKVLNLNISIWIFLAASIVLFCILSFSQNRLRFFVFSIIALFVSGLLSILFLSGMNDLSFVVTDGIFSPTDQMISHLKSILYWIPTVYISLSFIFVLLAVDKKWGISNLFRSIRKFFLNFFKKN